MLKVDALEFFMLGESTTKIAESVFFGSGKPIHEFQKETVKENITALAELCKRIGLSTSLTLLKDCENNLPQTGREWGMLVSAVRAELKTNCFLFVPSHRAQY